MHNKIDEKENEIQLEETSGVVGKPFVKSCINPTNQMPKKYSEMDRCFQTGDNNGFSSIMCRHGVPDKSLYQYLTCGKYQ